ncbi:hypothetical protein AURDEDRAFT_175904 [Auricularia subglabra TFB-10046 SS5]|uniref:Uncharacterized protein n=1 Tax=Auricularia subglabra (strain TFB-10046 / SS5) TaxID=717982 RepID=J0WQX6_AURST|nr:hypothetical protein AURDEDRAFT_175904 [Auricularia subglabra TFB-10046 SS5]
MPELRECIMHYTYLAWALWTFGFSIVFVLGMRVVSVHGPAWQVRAIFIDPTQPEYDAGCALARKLLGKCKRTASDHQLPYDAVQQRRFLAEQMYELHSTDAHLRRGGDQYSLWPPGIGTLSDLKLQRVQYAQRAVIFDFGTKWLMFHWLTHTSVQVYSPDEWRILRDIPRAGRHFKIAIAFVFDRCTIACESHDLLFQPKWLDEPPVIPPEMCPQVLEDWLQAGWAQRRAARDRLSMDVVRNLRGDGELFAGVGVYSESELFFMAGDPA